MRVLMGPDNPGLRLRLKLDFLLDNIAIVAREECGHQVIDIVYMWWGARSPHLFLCVYTVSVFHLSPLALPLFCFWSALYLSADRLIEARLDRGQINPDVVASFVNISRSETFLLNAGPVIRVLMGQRCPAKCTCTIMLHTRAQEHFIIGKVGGGNEQ